MQNTRFKDKQLQFFSYATKLCFLLVASLSIAYNVAAQEKASLPPCRSISPEPQTAPPDSPFCSPNKPQGYEINRVYIGDAGVRVKKIENSYVIIIAHLGTGEQMRRLNRTRLEEIKIYLEQIVGAKVITAEGERVKGFGRVEIYVAGRRLYSLPIAKGATLGLLPSSP